MEWDGSPSDWEDSEDEDDFMFHALHNMPWHERIFIRVPSDLEVRKRWFDAVQLPLNQSRNTVCCGDHFDLEEDSKNWKYFKMMGQQIKIRDDIVPHKILTGPPPQESIEKPKTDITESRADMPSSNDDEISVSNSVMAQNDDPTINEGDESVSSSSVGPNERERVSKKRRKKNKKLWSRKKRYQYTREDIFSALKAVGDGMSLSKASTTFSVPRTTIFSHLHKKVGKFEKGPSPILSKEEELEIVEWIEACAQNGFPRCKLDIRLSVAEHLKISNKENPFANGIPGQSWMASFIRRHPQVNQKISETMKQASSPSSHNRVELWFEQVQNRLLKDNLIDILDEPKRVVYGAETNFQLCPKNKTVKAEPGTDSSTLSVLFTFNGHEQQVPPMIILPYQRIPLQISDSVPSNWGLGRSDSGCMTSGLFFDFIHEGFNDFILMNGIRKPVVLFVDGNKPYFSMRVCKLCQKLGIILIPLYDIPAGILSPEDVAAMNPVKKAWRRHVSAWRREHPDEEVKHKDVASILEDVLEDLANSRTLINCFDRTGLFPWNRHSSIPCKVTDFCSTVRTNDSLTIEKFKQIMGDDVLMHLNDYDELQEIPSSYYAKKIQKLWQVLNKQSKREVSNYDENDCNLQQMKEDEYSEEMCSDSVGNCIGGEIQVHSMNNYVVDELFKAEECVVDDTCLKSVNVDGGDDDTVPPTDVGAYELLEIEQQQLST